MSTEMVPFVVELGGSPWPLWRQSADSKVALAKDLDVARWLGYTDLHKIRELITRYGDELGGVSATAAETSPRGGRPAVSNFLTREQALFIAAKSETPNATAVLKTMIAVFVKAHDLLAGYAERIAYLESENRRLSTARPASTLRPTDIAAAWARAHLEASKEPLPLREAWARYVVWSQEKGLPMPLHLSTLSSGVAAMFHQVRQPGRVAYYCAFRAEPLPVELPEPAQSRQQSLPFAAAQQHDGPDLADRALRVLERHPGGLGAEHMAQVLGAPVPVMTAVLGGMVEAGALGVKPAAARLLYRVAEREPEQAPMTDIQRRVYEYMETQPPGQRIPTQEIAKAIGCELSPSQLSKVGMAARALGYEQVRHESGSGWRKPEVN